MAEPTGFLPLEKDPLGTAVKTYAGIPLAAQSAEEFKKNLEASETAQKALQSRYDQPNWFNVAAGFFKPQLGGFAASLGSAAQALGQNEELRRSNEIPVATMRAQTAALAATYQAKQKAQKLIDDWDARGRKPEELEKLAGQVATYGDPYASASVKELQEARKNVSGIGLQGAQTKEIIEGSLPNLDARTQELLGNTPRAKAELSQMAAQLNLTVQDLSNRIVDQQLTKVEIDKVIEDTKLVKSNIGFVNAETGKVQLNTNLDAQRAGFDNMFITGLDRYLGPAWKVNRDNTRKDVQTALVATGLYTQDKVSRMTDKDLQDSLATVAGSYAETKAKTKEGSQLIQEATSGQLRDVGLARTLATGDGMARMMGIPAGQSAVSALFGYISDPNATGSQNALNRAAQQLSQDKTEKGQQIYADFLTLQKTLKRIQVEARDATTNPSVGAQIAIAQASPNDVTQTQKALVKILDLTASDISGKNRMAQLRQRWAGDDNDFTTNARSGYATLSDLLDAEKQKISIDPTNLSRETPSWYRPSIGGVARTTEAPAAAPAPAPAAGPAAQLPTVSSRAQFDALPSGALYLENGRKFRKP
jgi:hypothetical protein